MKIKVLALFIIFFSNIYCNKYYEATEEEKSALLINYYILHQEQHFKMIKNNKDTIIVYVRNIINEFRKKDNDGLFKNEYYQYFMVGFYNYKDSLIGSIFCDKSKHVYVDGKPVYQEYGINLFRLPANYISNYYSQYTINNKTYNNVYVLFDSKQDDNPKIYTSENIGIIRIEYIKENDTTIYDYCFDFKNNLLDL